MKNPLVFELQEGTAKEVAIQLTDRDRQLLRQFKSGPNGDLFVEELAQSVRVQAFSSIGIVRLDSLEIRIYPKVAKEQLRVVQMLGMTRGVDFLRRFKQRTSIAVDNRSLFDLIVLLLVEETEQLIRHGLLASYREEEELLSKMRGRLLADRQILERFGILDRLHCRFDELTSNIIENQLLARALYACNSLIVSPILRHRVQACLGDLLLNCPNLDERRDVLPDSIHYDRLNQHYQIAHELCWLVLSGIGVQDLHGNGSTGCFSFLINMSTLFEQFVETVLRRILRPIGYKVIGQSHDSTIIRDAMTGEPYSKVIPDLKVVSPTGSRYCVDAKYKLYNQNKIASADIYQLFLYAFAFANDASERRSVLVFPCETPEQPEQQLKIQCQDGSVGWVTGIGIHIPTVLDEMESNQTPSIRAVILNAIDEM